MRNAVLSETDERIDPGFGGPATGRLRVQCLGPESPSRRPAETLIERTYSQAFCGLVRRHYPNLVCVSDASGEVLAAAGVRRAQDEPLYLEQYLDAPIEVSAARVAGRAVARAEIGEIGNLASEDADASACLFLALAEILAQAGCTFAAATATRRLRLRFQRLGFPIQSLAPASEDRVDAHAADWGNYYSCGPEVLIGAVAPALLRLRAGRLSCFKSAAA